MRRNIILVTAIAVTIGAAGVAWAGCFFRCSYNKRTRVFECLSGPVLEECHTDVVPGGAVCWGVNCYSGSAVSGEITRWLQVDPQVLVRVVGPEVAALLESLWRESAEAAALGQPGHGLGEFSGAVAVGDRPLEVTFSIAGDDAAQTYVFQFGDGSSVEVTLEALPESDTATVRYRIARPNAAVEEGALEAPLTTPAPRGELVLRARPSGSGR